MELLTIKTVWIAFTCGMFIGVVIGVTIMCLLWIARRYDDGEEAV